MLQDIAGSGKGQSHRARGGGDDLEARVWRVALAVALLAVVVPDVVCVLLLEFVARRARRKLGAPERHRLLHRQSNALRALPVSVSVIQALRSRQRNEDCCHVHCADELCCLT